MDTDELHATTAPKHLAELKRKQGHYADAEPFYKRALAIWEKSLGPNHPDVATGLLGLAVLNEKRGNFLRALNLIQRASAIHRNRAARSGGQRSGGGLSEQKEARNVFVNHVRYVWLVDEGEPTPLLSGLIL